uniref:Uncharacterized protein n=1 Tax=Eutreptiella gymnastica TaxID=73025 RepID=A0A7S1NR00_9EUGL
MGQPCCQEEKHAGEQFHVNPENERGRGKGEGILHTWAGAQAYRIGILGALAPWHIHKCNILSVLNHNSGLDLSRFQRFRLQRGFKRETCSLAENEMQMLIDQRHNSLG